MEKPGQLIRNHPLTAGRWVNSDALQDLTKATQAPEDSSPSDEDPPEGVGFAPFAEIFTTGPEGELDDDLPQEMEAGPTYPAAVCTSCQHCYDLRPWWRRWGGWLLGQATQSRNLYCEARPRFVTYSPVHGGIVYLNSMFRAASLGLEEPHERCQDMNRCGECPLFSPEEE